MSCLGAKLATPPASPALSSPAIKTPSPSAASAIACWPSSTEKRPAQKQQHDDQPPAKRGKRAKAGEPKQAQKPRVTKPAAKAGAVKAAVQVAKPSEASGAQLAIASSTEKADQQHAEKSPAEAPEPSHVVSPVLPAESVTPGALAPAQHLRQRQLPPPVKPGEVLPTSLPTSTVKVSNIKQEQTGPHDPSRAGIDVVAKAIAAQTDERTASATAADHQQQQPSQNADSAAPAADTAAGQEADKVFDLINRNWKDPEYAAAWARFMRTFNERARTDDKCPQHIAAEIAQGVGNRKDWFNKWVAAGQSWMRAAISQEISEAEETESGVVRAWLTLDQAIDHFKSEVVGKAVVQAVKEKEPHHVKLNKYVPELAAATKYYIEISEQDAEKYKKSS